MAYSPWGHKRVGHDLVTQRQQQQIVYLKAERVGFVKLAIGAQLPYNAVLASTVQWSGSATRTHVSPLFWISFPFGSPQSTE